MTNKEECLLCHAPLSYLPQQTQMCCAACGALHPSNTSCENGHYICDACHQKGGLAVIRQVCRETDSTDPAYIAREIMDSPLMHMHGPEHHVLVGACLLAAYRNAGGALDLEKALCEMERRGSQVPGGICGLWGCCGAAISAGIYWSIITGASPLSTQTWGQANSLTSRCLASIAALGGPRCCKRDSFTAILEGAAMTNELLGIPVKCARLVQCKHSQRNAQCIGKRCPYRSI